MSRYILGKEFILKRINIIFLTTPRYIYDDRSEKKSKMRKFKKIELNRQSMVFIRNP